MGAGMCTGHPTWSSSGVLSAQAPSLLQLLYAGERAAPSCKSESRKGKAHRLGDR